MSVVTKVIELLKDDPTTTPERIERIADRLEGQDFVFDRAAFVKEALGE